MMDPYKSNPEKILMNKELLEQNRKQLMSTTSIQVPEKNDDQLNTAYLREMRTSQQNQEGILLEIKASTLRQEDILLEIKDSTLRQEEILLGTKRIFDEATTTTPNQKSKIEGKSTEDVIKALENFEFSILDQSEVLAITGVSIDVLQDHMKTMESSLYRKKGVANIFTKTELIEYVRLTDNFRHRRSI